MRFTPLSILINVKLFDRRIMKSQREPLGIPSRSTATRGIIHDSSPIDRLTEASPFPNAGALTSFE